MINKTYFFSILFVVFGLLLFNAVNYPKALQFFFPQKVWAHRVNSIIKLEETIKHFRGHELDVVFENGIFDVNHPPAESIGLSLHQYWNSLEEPNAFNFWLDVKNLSHSNCFFASKKLDSIVNILGIKKERIIVESPNFEFLEPFNNFGYKTAVYLPGNLNKMVSDSLALLIPQVASNIKNKPKIYLSFPIEDYQIVRENFPNRKKILWHTRGAHDFNIKLKVWQALFDQQVEVVLLPFNSAKGNR